MSGQFPSIFRDFGGAVLMDSVLEIKRSSYVIGNNVKQTVSSDGFLMCKRHKKLSFSIENFVPKRIEGSGDGGVRGSMSSMLALGKSSQLALSTVPLVKRSESVNLRE